MTKLTIGEAIARGAELGQQIENILGDINLQKLSRAAWLQRAAKLAGGDIEEAQRKAAGRRHFLSLVEMTGELWLRNGQREPAEAAIFDDPQREPGAFAERVAAGVTVAEASAMAAVRVAEVAPGDRWGRLSDFGEVERMLAPIRDELQQLDGQVAADLRVRDLAWLADGRPALAVPGRGTIVLSGENVGRLASASAEFAQQLHRQRA